MMMVRTLVLLTLLSVFHTGFAHNESVMILPFRAADLQAEPWEGLALSLALQDRVQDKQRLVPLTACRRQLNAYGLSVAAPVTLATAIKLAKDLNADHLVLGEIDENQIHLSFYDLNSGKHTVASLERLEHLTPELLTLVSEKTGLETKVLAPSQFDWFRVWASAYFLDELEATRRTFEKLMNYDAAGWLFMQEYLDLFGDPIEHLSEIGDLLYWRDLLTRVNHPSHALAFSDKVLDSRHNPADFVAHAGILASLDENEQACAYLEKAESFGFALGRLQAMREQCGSETRKKTTEVR